MRDVADAMTVLGLLVAWQVLEATAIEYAHVEDERTVITNTGIVVWATELQIGE